jgi:hypothetical protein
LTIILTKDECLCLFNDLAQILDQDSTFLGEFL